MDNLGIGEYVGVMLARLVTLFVILAITVVTSVVPAHAARMSADAQPEHALHVGMMMQASADSSLSCDGDQQCGPTDAGLCALQCAGLLACTPSPGGDIDHVHEPTRHDLPFMAVAVGSAPELAERPPKIRLL